MSYTATVHQPADVLHTVGKEGAIRVWSVGDDGTPHAVETTPEAAPDLSPVLDFTLEGDPLPTAEHMARAAGIALDRHPFRRNV